MKGMGATRITDKTDNTNNWHYDIELNLWVRKGYLIDTLGIDTNTIETGTSKYKRQASKAWAYEMKNGVLWLNYEAMPPQQRQRVEDYHRTHYKGVASDIFGIATETILKNRLMRQNEPTDDARYFMGLPAKKGGRAFTQSEADDLATGAQILRGLIEYRASEDYKHGVVMGKTKVTYTSLEFFEWFARVLKSWRIKCLNIGNRQVLWRTLNEFEKMGRDCLMTKKLGNENAQKMTDEMERTAIVLAGSVFKPTDRDIRQELEARYSTTLSDATVGNWLRKPENERKVLAVREGKIHAFKKHNLHISQAALRYADEMWFVDTTTVQLAVSDDAGKQVKIPMNRVTVLDGYSKKRVGVAYGVTETAELVWEALYFAFKTTGRLPNVLKSDNGGANTRADLTAKYKLLGITHITITPRRSTGQRDIEHDQHLHEKMLQRIMPNFTGGNFMGRGQQMRFNADNLKQMTRENQLPNWLQAVARDYEIFMANNSLVYKKGKTPNQLYADSSHEKQQRVTVRDLVNVFDPLSQDVYRLEHGQIKFDHNKQRYQYWVGTPMEADLDFFQRNEGNKFKIRFNPCDPSVIGLFSERWEFIAVAVQKHQFSQNPKALTSEERTALNRNLEGDKLIQQLGIEEYKALKADMEARGELTYIDWDTKIKEAVQQDTLSTMWDDVQHLGILDGERKRLQPKKQKVAVETNGDATTQIQSTPHFFAADKDLVQSLLD